MVMVSILCHTNSLLFCVLRVMTCTQNLKLLECTTTAAMLGVAKLSILALNTVVRLSPSLVSYLPVLHSPYASGHPLYHNSKSG